MTVIRDGNFKGLNAEPPLWQAAIDGITPILGVVIALQKVTTFLSVSLEARI